MNEQHTASTPAATSQPPSALPGVARVQTIPSPAGPAGGLRMTTSTLLGDTVAGVLEKIARILNPALVATTLDGARQLGHYAVLAGGALTLVYAIYGAIKFNSFAVFATGLGFVIAIAVAQFAAIRFLRAAESIIASTPSRVASSAFLDCAGLLVLLLAATTLLGGVATSITARSFAPLIPAILIGASLTCFGAIALHPDTVNVSQADGTAGEEAIGLLSFFFKTGLKVVPLFYLLFSVAGTLTLLMSFFTDGGAFASVAGGIVNILPLPVQVPPGLSGSALLMIACLIPIATYFVFLMEYLFVDVLRAVLAVPAKLDAIRR